MEVSRIIAEIDAQISKLQQARELLQGSDTGSAPKPGPGRPRKNAAAPGTDAAKAATPGKRKKRNLSEEARQRIAEAQKRRWAEKRGTAA